jgi:hypothetical protein
MPISHGPPSVKCRRPEDSCLTDIADVGVAGMASDESDSGVRGVKEDVVAVDGDEGVGEEGDESESEVEENASAAL